MIDCTYTFWDKGDLEAPDLPITFLRNYTDPHLESVSDAFALSAAHPEPFDELRESFSNPTNYMYDDYMEDLFSGVFSDFHANENVEPVDSTRTPTPFLSSPLSEQRTQAILSLLTNQHNLAPGAFRFPGGQFPVELASAAFTGNNIVKCVTAFFTVSHLYAPFIHRPSLDLEKVALPLLIAITLLGSVFAAPQDDALSVRCFFELGEELIFRSLHQVRTVSDQLNDESIQIVQAAVLMHALQMDSNNDSVRLRIRALRFPAIVAALRRLELFETVRKAQPGLADWDRFIADEVKIRLAARVFMTDCMSTLFFKSPPQITVVEVGGDLPSSDALFEASSSAEFSRVVASSEPFEPTMRSLKNLVLLFLDDEWAGPEAPTLAVVGSEHLISLMFAFQSLVFVSRTGLLVSSTFPRLLRATNRWKEVWHIVSSREVSSGGRLVGFAKYGLELWWLTQKILELAQREDTQFRYMVNRPTDSLKELHDFIQRYAEGQPT
ncbi:hypothetical protein BDW02DRAFT_138470 [Decorospora gaudefroyi]|uniref:Xylanolytic transcriptional activator regulatory domain-containing protein n=1 Tax=Decorospora gaudefroyi TaxID=184978 RepID=A0A6A5K564_9PLEO|nr:hypothetical protein BDW02DRAFT_138470 [Decorospora gaudefroyi]